MGKMSKKMVKQHIKNQSEERKHVMDDLEQKMQQQVAEEKFADALDTMAELAKRKCMDPEIMYDGALCYFMVGDYDRAANWINNTLTYKPDHRQARILLARLCLQEERVEDGLAVFDFVLEHYQGTLTAGEKEDISDILEYYSRNDADKLREHYPNIAAFLHLEAEEAAPEAAAAIPVASPMERARAAVAAMKQRLQQTEVKTAAPEPVPASAAEPAPTAEPAAAATMPAEHTAAGDRDHILAKDVSLLEKIALLNSFAGAYYAQGDFAAVADLLDTALKLDAHHEATLRNSCYNAVALGQKEKALEYAARLPMMDFALLDRIRQI